MDYEKIVVQWLEFEAPEVLERRIPISLEHDFITTITGPRRAGKTFLCFQVMKNLEKTGIPRKRIFYVNFEDEKLFGAGAKDIEKILEKFLEISEIQKNEKIFLFLDEIQNVKDWDVWVRRIHDLKKEIKIILTGSSSKLLSKEISTKLRGRVLNFEVFPLSFREFLEWRKIKFDEKTIAYSKERFAVKKEFSKYLSNGGYPATLTNPKEFKEKILQNYYQTMIFKDVVERNKVKEVKKLKTLASLLFESATKEISYNKLANKLKALGFSISKNTIIDYISMFEDAYLFFQNIKFEYSLTKQLGSIKKIYCIDNGLLNEVSFKFSKDLGKLLENAVFINLKRKSKETFYHRKNHECDFIIKEKNKITQAIQSSSELNEDNYNREINGLLEAMQTHKLKEGTIITLDSETEQKKIKGKTINIKPAWLWFLQES